MEEDQRQQQLQHWLKTELGLGDYTILPASADASFRRYFRVCHAGQTLIVMDAPPEKEDTRPFVAIANLFRGIGLNVPQVLEQDPGAGFILLTDLGTRLYLDALDAGNVDRLYTDAMNALLRLQSSQVAHTAPLPDYDEKLLLAEMGLFRDWYLERHLALSLAQREKELLEQTFQFLAGEALSQPRVCVHRDYHSRNLMLCKDNNPGILDFQDAVIGPLTYDLVSLLRDCYIRWPRTQVDQWLEQYREQAQRRGVIDKVSPAQFKRWFDLMGVQRHLKASGIFARLCHRDAKPGYLDDIPRTLSYVMEVATSYPELQFLHSLLKRLELAGV